MKTLTLVARILVGLVFTVFGLNAFLNFLHAPMPPGEAGAFMGAMFVTHFVYLVGAAQLLGGILFLLNRFVPLAIVILGAVLANIITFHLTMYHQGLGMAVIVVILWVIVALRYRANLSPLFVSKAGD